jgi:hypothetical protein
VEKENRDSDKVELAAVDDYAAERYYAVDDDYVKVEEDIEGEKVQYNKDDKEEEKKEDKNWVAHTFDVVGVEKTEYMRVNYDGHEVCENGVY